MRPNFDPNSEINGNQLNYVAVELSSEDIDRLEHDVNHNLLEPHDGFYFGELVIDPDDIADLHAFFVCARRAFSRGYRVYYCANW